MNIRILELIDGAKAAKGLTVIIDVFRAMTVEAYVIQNGAKDLIPMGDIDEAYAYRDAAGNLYRVYDYRNKKIDSYANVKTGEVTEASKLDGKLTVYYKGESDTSNLGSNKGIYDNKMNLYEELASAVTIISDNLFNIIEYFDNLHK